MRQSFAVLCGFCFDVVKPLFVVYRTKEVIFFSLQLNGCGLVKIKEETKSVSIEMIKIRRHETMRRAENRREGSEQNF